MESQSRILKAHQVKGSDAAREHMARLRSMRGGGVRGERYGELPRVSQTAVSHRDNDRVLQNFDRKKATEEVLLGPTGQYAPTAFNEPYYYKQAYAEKAHARAEAQKRLRRKPQQRARRTEMVVRRY